MFKTEEEEKEKVKVHDPFMKNESIGYQKYNSSVPL